LCPPIGLGGNRPKPVLSNGIAPFLDARQEEQGFLDVWSQVQQVHDLRDPRSRDLPEPGELSLIGYCTSAQEVIEPDGQRHELRYPLHTTRGHLSSSGLAGL
jgi:hypothetical protein